MSQLVEKLMINGEVIEIWQYDTNDFEIQYRTTGINYRSSLLNVMRDLHDCFRVFEN
jgi:hypothetical protein